MNNLLCCEASKSSNASACGSVTLAYPASPSTEVIGGNTGGSKLINGFGNDFGSVAAIVPLLRQPHEVTGGRWPASGQGTVTQSDVPFVRLGDLSHCFQIT
jgi:hypothetical protein